jgi:hypothetical protein
LAFAVQELCNYCAVKLEKRFAKNNLTTVAASPEKNISGRAGFYACAPSSLNTGSQHPAAADLKIEQSSEPTRCISLGSLLAESA